MSTAVPPLSGWTVLDLSTGIAGAYCTKLLADGGAEVVLVEPPRGAALRRWSASHTPLGSGADGPLFTFLSGAKRSVVVDVRAAADRAMLDGLLATADVVVWEPGSPIADDPAWSPAALRRAHRHLVVTAITPFGLDGPWAGRAATEFTLQAWSGGIIGLGRGAPERAPVAVGGRIGEWFAGAHASVATLTSRLRGGGGELIDLSILEAQILGLTYFPVTFHDALGRPFRTRRRRSVPGIATAADGLVSVGCGTVQQWFDLCSMVGHPEWIDEDTDASITERAAAKAPQIYAWLAGHPVDVVQDLASAFRIPNGPVADGANAPAMDHHLARESFVTDPRDGFVRPGPPYRFDPPLLPEPGAAPRLGEHTEHHRVPAAGTASRTRGGATEQLPFQGMRVLDLTTFWAGPSCTHYLAMLGAEVIHVESPTRLDGTRLIAGVPAGEDRWWEKSPIFSGLNAGKKSITVDLADERGCALLARLAATCDVVVENYTPRVLERIGLDYPAYRALRPDGIMVRMPGFGTSGPWRDNPAFAYVIEDTSGISWLTGHPDENPVQPYSIGDPNAGVHALNALLLALTHRRRTGEGTLIEAAMVEAALNVAAEQVVEYSANGVLLHRDGNRGPAAAPQNLYRVAGTDEFGGRDCWVAIAVATDGQWRRLRAALGTPFWMLDPALSSAAGRHARHTEIDARLAAWCADRDGAEVVRILWDAGVPVAEVIQPHRQADLPQLAFRGFFETVTHPVTGTARHSTVPARFSAGPYRLHRAPAPLLGQDNLTVLTALGLDATQISALIAAGVVGGEPTVAPARTAAR
ncbi:MULTISPECIES: CaiB/BaiF CoA-transferase family protein [unclassified Nocardia]|uniref:CaiB/BaiF CoA-transferase family protein n=1 Tax=unclassified Nocardia TaxID=2637762 RepID=UPI0033A5D5DC